MRERKVIKRTVTETIIFPTFKEAVTDAKVSRASFRRWLLNPHSRNGAIYQYFEETVDDEQWKYHPTIDVRISNKGRVETQRGKRYGMKTKDGYFKIKIKGKYYMTHRIIAETWVSNPSNKPYVNHIDHDKSNFNVNNLEWVTASENMIAWHEYKKL